MNVPPIHFLLALCAFPVICLCQESGSLEPAEETGFQESASQETEEILPSSHPVSRYIAIWENSPFNREVIAPVAQGITSSFANNLVLEGIVTDDTLGAIAYVRDTAEDKPLVITANASDSHPFTIVSSNLQKNPEETSVTITDGKEKGEIRYVAARLTQAIAQPVAQPQPGMLQPGAGRGKVPIPGGNLQGGGISGGALPDPAAVPNGIPSELQPSPAEPATGGGASPLNPIDTEPRRRRVPLPGGGGN